MSEPRTFGRRQAPQPAPPPSRPSAPVKARSKPRATSAQATEALSPAAEALRAELAAGRHGAQDGFAEWRRSQQAGRVFVWFMTFLLISPGFFCFLFQAPKLVSAGVEIAGLIGNGWLRMERRRHLQRIAGWQDPAAE